VKVVVLAIVVFLVIGGVLVFGDRDGLLYKKTSKLVRPLLGSSEITERMRGNYSGSFTPLLSRKQWRWFQPELVSVADGVDGVVLESQAENVWWKNWRGPYFYTYVSGDVDVFVRVRTNKASSPKDSLDRGYQFGGIMLRDPMGERFLTNENYVFNVVGYRGKGLQVETKSTLGGWSDVRGHDWPTGDAELRIVRSGASFKLFARQIGEIEWHNLIEYMRPDLPGTLQLGIIAYAYSAWSGEHDLQANFEHIELILLDNK